MATAAVAALGLAGLACARRRSGRSCVCACSAGWRSCTAGHAGTLAFPRADAGRAALDGVLAPFRNLHKFDALIRLPLALGLAALPIGSGRPGRPRPPVRPGGARRRRWSGALTPIATAGHHPAGAVPRAAVYWRDAAAWLATGRGRTVLVVPGPSAASTSGAARSTSRCRCC